MFTKAGAQSVDIELRKLLPVLGASREDMPLLQFWMTGLSVQYKRHMLVSAKGMREWRDGVSEGKEEYQGRKEKGQVLLDGRTEWSNRHAVIAKGMRE